MNEVSKALESADWAGLHLRLLSHAHYELRDYRWRGLRVAESSDGKLTLGGMGPDDFVIVAVEKLAQGRRTYRSDVSLEQNICSAIDSEIANYHKKARRLPLSDRTRLQAAVLPDPLDLAVDDAAPPNPAENAELVARQQELRQEFGKSLAGDDELTWIFLCYESGLYKPAVIAAESGIHADRVSELKRKFEQRAEKFMRTHPAYADQNYTMKEAS